MVKHLDLSLLDEADEKIKLGDSQKEKRRSPLDRLQSTDKDETKKKRVRYPMSISINEDIRNMIDEYCKKNLVNKSAFVEKLIIDFFESKNK